ncbi:MAG: prolipoprotein diacylglyceryl transferase [Nitrospirae bacterium]|nr:prolipoprotein diacylglyceryl transferase [Nitrospirota bacterium]
MGRAFFYYFFSYFGGTFSNIFLHGYWIFAAIGTCVFLFFIHRELRLHALSSKYLLFLILSLIMGLLLSKIPSVVNNYSQSGSITLRGGFVFFGGLLGTLGVLLILITVSKMKLYPFLDIVCVYIPLAHSFGRIGCFLAGCCFGMVCNGPLCIEYPLGSHAYREQIREGLINYTSHLSLPVFPVQIVESIGNLCIFCVLYIIYKKGGFKNGTIVKAYLITYSLVRFFLEFLRGDTLRGMYFGFSTSQYISAVIVAVIVISIIFEDIISKLCQV